MPANVTAAMRFDRGTASSEPLPDSVARAVAPIRLAKTERDPEPPRLANANEIANVPEPPNVARAAILTRLAVAKSDPLPPNVALARL